MEMLNENTITMNLLDNPKYSSEWVKHAAHLIYKCGLTENELSVYNAEQLGVLVSMFTSAEENKEIWIEGFFNPALNATQMQILLTGYSHNLTTEQLKPYFNPDIPYIKSNWAITALAEGFDLTSYIEEGFDKDQLYEIYAGKKDGIDVSVYDKKDIPAEKMAIAHHALVMGLKVQFSEEKILTI